MGANHARYHKPFSCSIPTPHITSNSPPACYTLDNIHPGIKIWLPLQPLHEGANKGFMSKRIMLPFHVDIYPIGQLSLQISYPYRYLSNWLVILISIYPIGQLSLQISYPYRLVILIDIYPIGQLSLQISYLYRYLSNRLVILIDQLFIQISIQLVSYPYQYLSNRLEEQYVNLGFAFFYQILLFAVY